MKLVLRVTVLVFIPVLSGGSVGPLTKCGFCARAANGRARTSRRADVAAAISTGLGDFPLEILADIGDGITLISYLTSYDDIRHNIIAANTHISLFVNV